MHHRRDDPARLLRVSGEWASGMPCGPFGSLSRDRAKPSARLWPSWQACHTIRERERRWHTTMATRPWTHPVVRRRVREMLDKEDKDFSGALLDGENGPDAIQ